MVRLDGDQVIHDHGRRQRSRYPSSVSRSAGTDKAALMTQSLLDFVLPESSRTVDFFFY